MEKQLYSIMLFDDIIEAVDAEAFSVGTNRSQLINDILAEYFGLQTPEQKIRRIFESIGERFSDTLSAGQIVGNGIQFGKSLKFKYRPKLRYIYEFIGSGSDRYAVLKVSARTTNPELNEHLDSFFARIVEAEDRCDSTEGCCGSGESNHRFVREFKESGEMSRDSEDISINLFRYLDFLDTAMDLYFEDPEDQTGFDEMLDRLFEEKYLARRT